MRKKLWIGLALMFVMPGFLFTVSCARKPVKPDQPVATTPAASTTETEKGSALSPAEAEKQRIREEKLRVFQNDHIYFAFDSAVLSPAAQMTLKEKAEWMNENPMAKVSVEGHCDERGTPEYNLALGDRRAKSAGDFLVELGIDPARLNLVSYGEERPLDPSSNEEAWAKNRRGQFVVQ